MDNTLMLVLLLNVCSCLTQDLSYNIHIGANATFQAEPNKTKELNFFNWATNKTGLASPIAFFLNSSGSCTQQGTFNATLYAATCVSTEGPYFFHILNIDDKYQAVIVRCAIRYRDTTTDYKSWIITVSGTTNGTCITDHTNPTCITDERVIGIVEAIRFLIDVLVFILLLYYSVAILNLFHVVNIAENPCQRRVKYVLLFVFAVILGVRCVVTVIVLPPLVIEYATYKTDLVIGISFLLFPVWPAIFTLIYWIAIMYVCGPRNARCCINTINNSESETTKESTRISINGNAGLRSPGRRLPPLPPLIRTDPETPDKKEKKKKKKNKPELNEDQHAEKNNSEIKHEEDAEN